VLVGVCSSILAALITGGVAFFMMHQSASDEAGLTSLAPTAAPVVAPLPTRPELTTAEGTTTPGVGPTTPPATTVAMAPPPAPVATPPSPPPASAPDPDPPRAASLSAKELADLIARGDQLLATGDIAAARQFYQRAAEAGSAAAATGVGKTYDPLFLAESRAQGFRGDLMLAAQWYLKASAAGDPQADEMLRRLKAKFAG